MCIFLIYIHEIIGYLNIIYYEMKIYLSGCYMRVEVIDMEQTKNEAKKRRKIKLKRFTDVL